MNNQNGNFNDNHYDISYKWEDPTDPKNAYIWEDNEIEINENPDSIEHLEEKQKAVEETINNIIEIKGD